MQNSIYIDHYLNPGVSTHVKVDMVAAIQEVLLLQGGQVSGEKCEEKQGGGQRKNPGPREARHERDILVQVSSRHIL